MHSRTHTWSLLNTSIPQPSLFWARGRPKKNGKWRVIMHLSAPPGDSINDFIDPREFPMHYSSVDDAVRLIHSAGQGALMAKVDLKAAFRMVPVQRSD